MYDDEGNTTLQSDDVAWVYIFNKNTISIRIGPS